MRVLVIDDSAVARATLRRTLVEAGFEVFELPSGIGATRTLLQKAIDAAVIDVTMPGLSGDKLVTVLRQNPRLSHLVIVLISAKSRDELQEVAQSCGVDDILTKDEVGDQLVACLRRLLLPGSAEGRRGPGAARWGAGERS